MPLSFKEFTEVLRRTPKDATDEQVNAAAQAREAGTPLERLWKFVNRPLVGSEDALIPGTEHTHGEDESTVRRVAEDLGSSLTSPLNLGTTALGIGGAAAGAKGLLGISRAARYGEAALTAPLAAEGVKSIIDGETTGEKLGGALQAGLAGYGVANALSHSFPVKKVADTYMAEKGLTRQGKVAALDPERSMRIADAYEAMPHNPADPKTAASYGALGNEVEAQYDFLVNRAGVQLEPWTKPGQPYTSSADMVADVERNNHLYYFPSEAGFGEDVAEAGNPLLAKGQNGVVLNDQFRAVHDYFGHAQNKNQFGPKGEEAAWVDHSEMFTPEARPAMTTETRGQNSWVNFGKHLRNEEGVVPKKGEPGFVPPQERPFAQQKTGLLPEEFVELGPRNARGAEILPSGRDLLRGVEPPGATPNTAPSALPTGRPVRPLEGLSDELVGEVNAAHTTNGGSTTSLIPPARILTPKDGRYMLSPFEDRQVKLDHPPTMQELRNFAARNEDLLSQPGHNLGTWWNKDGDGLHYLDVSIAVNDLDQAKALAQKHNQLAIYDMIEGTDIPIQGAEAPKLGPGAATLTDPMTGQLADVEPAPKVNPATAFSLAAPVAAANIDDSDPNDPYQGLKQFGKIALNLMGVAGLGAAIRKNAQSPQKAAAARGAAYMLLGGSAKAWEKKMLLEGVSSAELPKIRAASEKILSAQLAKAENGMPNTKKLMAHFDAGQAEMGWYDEVHKELEELFGKDAGLVAQLLAATSSNATVKSNVSLALKAYAMIKAGGPIEKGFLPAVVMQVNRVARGEGLEGRKIDNFAKAIMGDPDAVVVDRWMMRAFGFTKDAPTPHQYDVIETAVKELAKQKGVSPRQMQAAIWFSVKNKTEAASGRVNPAPPYGKLLREKQANQSLPLE